MATDMTANGRRTALNGRQRPKRGDLTWEVARAFPLQGYWSEEEYLDFEESSGNQMVELIDGFLEFLPMPDLIHQGILQYTFRKLDDHAKETEVGEVFTAPCPVRMRAGHMREPDIFLVEAHRIKDRRQPPEGADLVVEIPSPGKENRKRDLQTKRRVYAAAKISEYWIIDPEKETITVFALSGKAYKVHGRFKPGERAASKLLPGFSLDVAAVFAAGKGKS
jgi:Uma2 family endonuclease